MISVVHPASGSFRDPMTARPERHVEDLAGREVVLFSNNKPNVGIFLDELEQNLRRSGVHVSRLSKLSSAFPAPPEVLEKVRAYEFAINAVAD